jgi:hypothetical protein
LQHVYATTIKPERDHRPRSNYRGRGGYRNQDTGWTQKKGETDAMNMMKDLRDGKRGEKAQDAMAEFVRLVEETFGSQEKEGNEMNMG